MRGTSSPHTYQSTPRASRTIATGSPAFVFTHCTMSSLTVWVVGDAVPASGVAVGVGAMTVGATVVDVGALWRVAPVDAWGSASVAARLAMGTDMAVSVRASFVAASWANWAALDASTWDIQPQPASVRLTAPTAVVTWSERIKLLASLRGFVRPCWDRLFCVAF